MVTKPLKLRDLEAACSRYRYNKNANYDEENRLYYKGQKGLCSQIDNGKQVTKLRNLMQKKLECFIDEIWLKNIKGK